MDDRIELPERVGLLGDPANVVSVRQIADHDAGGPFGQLAELGSSFGRGRVQDDLMTGVQKLLSRGTAEAGRGAGDEDG